MRTLYTLFTASNIPAWKHNVKLRTLTSDTQYVGGAPKSAPRPNLSSTDTDHIEGAGCLFEEPHQPALREVLAAADTLLVGAHDVVWDRALL